MTASVEVDALEPHRLPAADAGSDAYGEAP